MSGCVGEEVVSNGSRQYQLPLRGHVRGYRPRTCWHWWREGGPGTDFHSGKMEERAGAGGGGASREDRDSVRLKSDSPLKLPSQPASQPARPCTPPARGDCHPGSSLASSPRLPALLFAGHVRRIHRPQNHPPHRGLGRRLLLHRDSRSWRRECSEKRPHYCVSSIASSCSPYHIPMPVFLHSAAPRPLGTPAKASVLPQHEGGTVSSSQSRGTPLSRVFLPGTSAPVRPSPRRIPTLFAHEAPGFL